MVKSGFNKMKILGIVTETLMESLVRDVKEGILCQKDFYGKGGYSFDELIKEFALSPLQQENNLIKIREENPKINFNSFPDNLLVALWDILACVYISKEKDIGKNILIAILKATMSFGDKILIREIILKNQDKSKNEILALLKNNYEKKGKYCPASLIEEENRNKKHKIKLDTFFDTFWEFFEEVYEYTLENINPPKIPIKSDFLVIRKLKI